MTPAWNGARLPTQQPPPPPTPCSPPLPPPPSTHWPRPLMGLPQSRGTCGGRILASRPDSSGTHPQVTPTRPPPPAPHVPPPLHCIHFHLCHMLPVSHYQWLHPPPRFVCSCVKCTVEVNFSFPGTGLDSPRAAERSAGSAVDAGHLDMGTLRANSSTTPQPATHPASGPRRATLEPHATPSVRVRPHPICNALKAPVWQLH